MLDQSMKASIVYQIWPRSFLDTNGDGIGDLGGVIAKLDRIASLGVNYIWLSPVYPSPNSDYGYDIADYRAINPEFGTMDDFERLIREADARGIGILMDFVPNHTSSEHEWFKKALAGDPYYRDFYYFRKGRNGGAPNNWLSFFGGSAWTQVAGTDEYYLTSFTPAQCDLNWDNENVRREMKDVLKFWVDKGVKGFRMDVVNTIKKAPGLPDKDPQKKGLQFPGDLIANLPGSHDYIKELHDEVLEPYGCFSVGEGVFTGPDEVTAYTRPENGELMMMFHFDLHGLGCGPLGKFDFRKLYRWSIKDFISVTDKWQTTQQESGGWVGNYLSNHDQPRHISRFGNDDERFRKACGRAFCMYNYSLRGTPFIYQGEEFGMTNCRLEPDEWRDYEAINDYKVLQSMMHLPAFIAKKIIMKMTRDHARTPVQWTGGRNAGFSTHEPWIKLNPNYTYINADDDENSSDSLTAFYRDMAAFRKENEALVWGEYVRLETGCSRVIGFTRTYKGRSLLVLINLSDKPAKLYMTNDLPGDCLIATGEKRPFSGNMKLAAYEGLIFG